MPLNARGRANNEWNATSFGRGVANLVEPHWKQESYNSPKQGGGEKDGSEGIRLTGMLLAGLLNHNEPRPKAPEAIKI